MELSVRGQRGRGVTEGRRQGEALQEENTAGPSLWRCPRALSSHTIPRGGTAIVGGHFSCALNVTVTLKQTKKNISFVL